MIFIAIHLYPVCPSTFMYLSTESHVKTRLALNSSVAEDNLELPI